MKNYIFAGITIVVSLFLLVWVGNELQGNGASFGTDARKSRGPARAPIQIIEYSDFQCPACARAQPILDRLLQDYEGKVRLTFRHFPLAGHKLAKPAHQAAECAARQGQFWAYHDRLYAEQAAWSRLEDPTETFLRYAEALGLNMDKFAVCLASDEVAADIFAEKEEGTAVKIGSTPTFFINDRRFVGSVELDQDGEAFIREVLGK